MFVLAGVMRQIFYFGWCDAADVYFGWCDASDNSVLAGMTMFVA